MDDETLRALAAGAYPPSDAEARALAAEMLRLRRAVRRYMGAGDLLHRARRDGDGDVIAAEADKGDAWVVLADLVKYGPYAEGIE